MAQTRALNRGCKQMSRAGGRQYQTHTQESRCMEVDIYRGKKTRNGKELERPLKAFSHLISLEVRRQ